MNVINVTVKFEKGKIYKKGIDLVTNDYNSTKIVFDFDDEEGTKIFELKNTSNEVIFADEVVNNEIILARFDENEVAYPIFTQDGIYTFEVSLYKNNSKLTSASTYLRVVQEEVTFNGETVETYTPMFDNLLSDLANALEETENLDIDVSKNGTVATVSITNKSGITKTVSINDGAKGDKGDTGATGQSGANATINGINTLTIEAGDNITLDQEGSTLTINSTGGGGGSSDYEDLENLPKVNSVELKGNKSLSDLGIQPAGSYLTSETDPIFSSSASAGITSSDITNWNAKGTYSKPNDGIPSTDLSSAVQTSLGKADTAIQDISGKQDKLIASTNITIASDGKTISATDTTYNNATTATAGLMSAEDKTKLNGIATGATANTGTITSVKMNGSTISSSGEADLGTVITSHQDISGKEDKSNKVTSLSSNSTDTQYPSAKCVYDLVGNIESLLSGV